MNKDKTSWLFENTDNDDENEFFENDEADFTETLDDVTGGFPPATQVSDEKTSMIVSEESDKTQIFFGANAEEVSDSEHISAMDDPVVGWLVVVNGPGLGRSVSIGVGMNSIGRDAAERVALPFGDKLISSKEHVRIIYDDESRSFLIAPGSGTNLTKIGNTIVAAPTVLENYAVISLSKQTKVRFVAFCDESFDWSDVVDAKDKS